jgi:hypothetical protein
MFNGMEAMEAVASSVLDEHSCLVFMHKYMDICWVKKPIKICSLVIF